MDRERDISRVVVVTAGTRMLRSLVKHGCAGIHNSGGHLTILSLSTSLERIAARCPLSEALLPTLLTDELAVSRASAFAEALLACPRAVTVDFEILLDWTPGSVLRRALRLAPDAVVLGSGLHAVRRTLRKRFALRVAGTETRSQDLFFYLPR
jgi:hypothetical protein